MSNPAGALRTKLLTISAVTDEVGAAGVYFNNLPQTATLPAIVVEMVQSDRMRAIGAAQDFYRSVVEVACYAASQADAVTVGDAVTANIDFDATTWGSLVVSRALVDNVIDLAEAPDDGSDAWRRIRNISLIVWHS